MIAYWRRSAAYRIAIVYSAGFALALSVLWHRRFHYGPHRVPAPDRSRVLDALDTPYPQVGLQTIDFADGDAQPRCSACLCLGCALIRAAQPNGHGLGLNLVAAIATAHDNPLMVEDTIPDRRVALVIADSGSSV